MFMIFYEQNMIFSWLVKNGEFMFFFEKTMCVFYNDFGYDFFMCFFSSWKIYDFLYERHMKQKCQTRKKNIVATIKKT